MKQGTITQPLARYSVGEDVVLRLEGVETFDVDTGRPACCLPSWTIATVLCASESESPPVYVLRFRHRGGLVMCMAPPSAIEGVA